MLRILSKLKPLPFCASFSLFRKDFDIPIAQNALHKDEEMTGWDRVRSIFYVEYVNSCFFQYSMIV